MSPGIRVGWMECPSRIVDVFNKSGVIKSGGAVNNYSSGIISSCIELGLSQRILNNYSAVYKERLLVVCDILEKNLPENCYFYKPSGGYFVWITLPENIDSNKLNEFCKINYKVFFVPGDRFSIEKKFKNCLRITIGFQSGDTLKEGVTRLCVAITEFIVQNI